MQRQLSMWLLGRYRVHLIRSSNWFGTGQSAPEKQEFVE